MSEFPNLLPGITPDQLDKILKAAGALESLPELVNRLAGYTASLLDASIEQTALVLNRQPLTPWSPGTPAPITVDPYGFQWGRQRALITRGPILTIPAGAQDGAAVAWAFDPTDMGRGVIVFDDPNRVETMTVQGSIDQGVTFWNVTTNLFTGAFNSAGAIAGVGANIYPITHIRARLTAAPAATARAFQTFLIGV